MKRNGIKSQISFERILLNSMHIRKVQAWATRELLYSSWNRAVPQHHQSPVPCRISWIPIYPSDFIFLFRPKWDKWQLKKGSLTRPLTGFFLVSLRLTDWLSGCHSIDCLQSVPQLSYNLTLQFSKTFRLNRYAIFSPSSNAVFPLENPFNVFKCNIYIQL